MAQDLTRYGPRLPHGRAHGAVNAGLIIAAWEDWYEAGSGVPVPDTVKARLGKQVKQLIESGYTADEIKHGLAIWTVEQMDNAHLPPTWLDNYVWRYAQDTRPGASEWRDAVRQRVAEFAPRRRTRGEERHDHNQKVLRDWKDGL